MAASGKKKTDLLHRIEQSTIVRSIRDGHVTTIFVEAEEEKETLHEIGCDNYQGYLYSPAVFL